YNIATNQITFTNNSSSSATNSISMTDNYSNVTTWLGGSITSGNINFVFSNIPSSVTSVSGGQVGSNASISFPSPSTTNIVTNSATLSASILAGNPGSATFSFTFSNSGNIATGTINVAVNGSSLRGGGDISNTSPGSFTWLSATPFVTFVNSTANIYGELVYLSSSIMPSIYNEELRLVLPSGVSASNVSISLAGNSCSNLSQYVSSSVSEGNQTSYSLNVANLFTSCLSNTSYNNGDLMPVQISFTLPPGATISQVSGVAMAWGAGISKRLPLNVVYGSTSHLTY
ncbi:MAG: hypothetical protein QXU98_13925, partial [Candidatus Parvarchaeota archaeon]